MPSERQEGSSEAVGGQDGASVREPARIARGGRLTMASHSQTDAHVDPHIIAQLLKYIRLHNDLPAWSNVSESDRNRPETGTLFWT